MRLSFLRLQKLSIFITRIYNLPKCENRPSNAREALLLISYILQFKYIVNLINFQESTEEELEKLLDRIMVLFRFIQGNLLTKMK